MGEQRSNGSLRLCLAPVGSLSLSASEKVWEKGLKVCNWIYMKIVFVPKLFLKHEIPQEHYLARKTFSLWFLPFGPLSKPEFTVSI